MKSQFLDSSLRGLYLNAAFMNHNCLANTHLAVDDDFFLYIHASVDIEEGKPICFSYANVLEGVDERNRHLKEGKYFNCECTRCQDPTELQTEMSSVLCPKCRKGFIRPKLWRCLQCGNSFNKAFIKLTIDECRRKIEDLDHDAISLENLLSKLTLTFHPQHYLLLEIEQNLVRFYSEDKKHLERKVQICNKLLSVFKKLEPGISRIQGITLYELHSGLYYLAKKQFAKKEIGEEEFLTKLMSAEKVLKEAIGNLLYEPSKSPEGRLTQNALSELKMLRLSIKNLAHNSSQ